MAPKPTPLDLAAYALCEAKAAEEAARQARIAAEQNVITLVGLKDEGRKTEKTAYYKVSTTSNMTYSLKPDWKTVLDQDVVDAEMFSAVIKMEPKLSISGLKHVATANPAAYAVLVQAIVVRPAKPSVSVELLPAKAEAA